MPEFSPQTKQLIQRYRAWWQSLEPTEKAATLHVDEIASTVAKFYEKIRGIVDWREEHLLRKSAVERVFRRRNLVGEDTTKMAEPIVLELIRGGHFPNDAIPEEKIPEVQAAIDKHIFILQNAPQKEEKLSLGLQDWILSVAACELEEILSPPSKEKALVNFMTVRMEERIDIKGEIPERRKRNQISIACQQALFKVDPPLIGYNLLQLWYPEWKNLQADSQELSDVTQKIYELQAEVQHELAHPLASKLYSLCEKHDTAYLLLGDIIEKDPMGAEERLANPAALEGEIKNTYNKRLWKSRAKVKRAAIYSTLSIFLTKVVLALGVEIPVDRYITGNFDPVALAINIAIPPLLMTILVMSIRPPSIENLQRAILEVAKLTYASEQKETYIVRQPRKKGITISLGIFVFYVLSFGVSFGGIILVLTKLHFTILSQIIFLMFISLISFAGAKLRQRSKELIIQEEKGFFLIGFLDLFALPIVQVGKWLSGKMARYNIFIILLNALVEMPLQMFIEFLEQWRYFLKEKKEEIH